MEESSDSSDDSDSGRRSINDSESDCDEERSYSSGEPASKPPKIDEEDEETLDRLSALPDSLILQILSLLPMEEDYSQSERFEKFINFLEKTLSLSSCSKIRKFAVQFDYDAFLYPDVDLWISFALTRYVEDLDLNFISPQSFDGTDIYRYTEEEDLMRFLKRIEKGRGVGVVPSVVLDEGKRRGSGWEWWCCEGKWWWCCEGEENGGGSVNGKVFACAEDTSLEVLRGTLYQ
ncbi:hypothetical protein F0562_018421 [Nyssa sinensis]|uniref:F-box domain-containing protein n=1 Tax=Nyssa sinensis TaxID=561372 RepID=A0A5J4ZBU1_9ASTE|nr:hypothetical protein F0562_018421 [Nyssa sinensis]